MEEARPMFVNSTEASAAETGIKKRKEQESAPEATANRADRGRGDVLLREEGSRW